MSASSLNLPDVQAPANGLQPAWVKQYADTVKLMANATVSYQTAPPYGSGSWTFSGSNAVLTLRMNAIPSMDPNTLYNGTINTGKGTGGVAGSLSVQNGLIVKSGTLNAS